MKRVAAVVVSVLLLVTVTAAQNAPTSATTENAPAPTPTPWPGDNIYSRPGQLVSVGTHRLNLYCMGSGSPAVIFDSGWEDWAPAWSKVQPEVAKFTRACSYDRAGAGFSEPGPMPRTSVRIADELHTALHKAGVGGPYILVGIAFGGDNVRTFADLHLDEIAGLVLMDADADDLVPISRQQQNHRDEVGIISQLRDCRNLIAEHKPLPELPPRPGQPHRTCAHQFLISATSSWAFVSRAPSPDQRTTFCAIQSRYFSLPSSMGSATHSGSS
jgi:pimeloyl-ACP methyl ester carboxylesterase